MNKQEAYRTFKSILTDARRLITELEDMNEKGLEYVPSVVNILVDRIKKEASKAVSSIERDAQSNS
jgi:hypothetical protein